jgi:cell division protein FtsL
MNDKLDIKIVQKEITELETKITEKRKEMNKYLKELGI